MAEFASRPGTGAAVEKHQELKRPCRYKVLLLNDHYTTMDFVVRLLEAVFLKSRSQAIEVMLKVHENGMGVAGVYVRDIAETKISAAHSLARDYNFPLRCMMEPE